MVQVMVIVAVYKGLNKGKEFKFDNIESCFLYLLRLLKDKNWFSESQGGLGAIFLSCNMVLNIVFMVHYLDSLYAHLDSLADKAELHALDTLSIRSMLRWG